MCQEQSAEDAETGSTVRLLYDLREVFQGEDRLYTDEILRRLYRLPESGWNATEYGQSVLNAHKLSVMLRGYDLRSRRWRVGTENKHGYERSDLEDVWARYLPSIPVPAGPIGSD